MTEIRPLDEGDLPRVADLLAAALPDSWPPQAWRRLLRSTLLESPSADPDLPSLVWCDDGGVLRGFIALNVRRATFDGRPVRLACSSHLAIDAESRGTPAGAFLLRAALQGAQDATFTDTAGPPVRALWESLGGRCEPLRSLQWMQVLRPARWFMRSGIAGAQRQRVRLLVPVSAVPLRPLLPSAIAPRTWRTTEPAPDGLLDVEAFVEHVDRTAPPARLRPRYDHDYVAWLFQELEAAADPSATVLRRLVRRRGRVVGWYVCRIDGRGGGRVLQVLCRPPDAEEVLADLFAAAAAQGAVVLAGRVEPHLSEALYRHDCVIGMANRHLVHAREPELLEAFGSSSLTLLDGEWW